MLLFIFKLSVVSGQTDRIQLLHANSLEYDELKTGKVKRLIGDVSFKQQNTILYCDSAYQFEDQNKVEAYGNVRINHQDSIHFYGKKMLYDGNTKTAILEKDVRMTDNQMQLFTNRLDFDLTSNTGYYSNGGKIVSEKNILTSMIGYYFSNSSEVFFKKNVKIVTPEYQIISDTLRYATNVKIAQFYGPTTITGKDKKLYCERGTFDTRSDIARFGKNAYVINKDKTLKADSIYYDNRTEFGRAWFNIEMIDTSKKLILYGDEGVMYGAQKQQFITKNAAAKQYMDNDSLYLFADSILSYQLIGTQQDLLKCYRNVKIIKTDLQSVCDSLVYTPKDSTITLFKQPVLWSGVNQVTADTIKLFLNNNKIDSFLLQSNGFLVSREGANEFNQMVGRVMYGLILDSKIKYVHAEGNAQSIYYAKEDSSYIGVNVINCSEMTFYFKEGKIERSNFMNKPDAVFYPLNELKPEELRLKGFKWRAQKRPNSAELLRTLSAKYK